jgi:hypothetical protein
MGRAFGQGGGIMRGGFDDDSYTPEMRSAPAEMPTFDEAEQRERIKQQWADESSLIHQYLRSPMQTLDQGEQGFCWAYSTVSAIMLTRVRDGLPHVRLSAHGLACRIMNFQDRGAWSGLSAKHAAEIGCPSVETWPERSMNREHNNVNTWEDAKRFIIKDQWYDVARREWDQVLTSRQINTQLLLNNPVAADFMAISHAMCIVVLGIHPDGDIMRCVLNSWRNWGNRGLGWLRGSWANPRSAVAMFQPTMTV